MSPQRHHQNNCRSSSPQKASSEITRATDTDGTCHYSSFTDFETFLASTDLYSSASLATRCRHEPMTPRFLYFDLGWTLIDEMPAHRQRAQLVSNKLAATGIHVSSEEFIAQCFRCGTTDARSPFRAALQEFSPPAPTSETMVVPYEATREKLFDGVPEMLAQLAMRFRLGVIANQSVGTEDRLRKFRIRNHFEVILASTEFGIAKPDPRVFAEAERRARVNPDEIVMIGDRLDNDIRPARARGWRTIRVRQGFSKDQISANEAERPDVEITDVTELLTTIERLGAP